MPQHFPNVPVIAYEGPKSRNPFAFKHYDAEHKVGGKRMKDHFRFAAAYWHVMRNARQRAAPGAGVLRVP
jgi:xylose isomerase